MGEGGDMLHILTGCLPCTGISFIFKHHPQALIASLGQLNAPHPQPQPLGSLNLLRRANKTQVATNVPVDNYLVFKTSNAGKLILPSCVG